MVFTTLDASDIIPTGSINNLTDIPWYFVFYNGYIYSYKLNTLFSMTTTSNNNSRINSNLKKINNMKYCANFMKKFAYQQRLIGSIVASTIDDSE